MAANGLINSKILINGESPTGFAIFKIFSTILKRRVINCALLRQATRDIMRLIIREYCAW